MSVGSLTAPEWIELSVGVGTGLLALATAWMAWHVRGQAIETRRLADTAERQLEATTTAVLRLMREDDPNQADLFTVNEGDPGERLVARFENRGAAAAGFEHAAMSPGGRGTLAATGLPESPVLEPKGEWDVDFNPSETDKGRHARGHEVMIQVIYESLGSGVRYRRRTYAKRDLEAPHERWLVLREEAPERL